MKYYYIKKYLMRFAKIHENYLIKLLNLGIFAPKLL